jgi:AcrR family transcriptional regulator
MIDTYNRILDTAKLLYHEGGFQSVTMRKVAAELDLSATAIYRHFRNKEHLLIALFEDAHRTFTRYLWESLGGGTPLERFRSAGEAYLRFALEEPLYYQMVFMAPSSQLGYEEMPETVCEELNRSFHFLVDRVRECMDEGLFIEGDPERTAVAVWAHSHGVISLYLTGQLDDLVSSRRDFEAFYWEAMRPLMQGLQPQDTGGPDGR